MAWQDRNYADGGGGLQGNWAGMLNYSLALGTWRGVRVRLHLWLLIVIFFAYLQGYAQMGWTSISVGLLILALVIHEMGHRLAAGWYGLRHDDWLLWPVGGMIRPPAPPGPLGMAVVNGGGIAANLVTIFLCWVGLHLLGIGLPWRGLQWLSLLVNPGTGSGPAAWKIGLVLGQIIFTLSLTSAGLVVINLLPFYLFDGGYLLEALIRPWTTRFGAINITCWVGMILCVPMALLAMRANSIFGLIFCGVLFYLAYSRRRQLRLGGAEALDEQAFAYSASQGGDSTVRERRRWAREKASAARRAAGQQDFEARIDRILDKVRQQGMQSLSGRDKRLLKKATRDAQRKRSG